MGPRWVRVLQILQILQTNPLEFSYRNLGDLRGGLWTEAAAAQVERIRPAGRARTIESPLARPA